MKNNLECGDSSAIVWNVPERNLLFEGRQQALENLATNLNNSSVCTITQAITGLGGIGKTQLAKEYAHLHKQHYQLTWWLDAKNLDQDYQKLATAINAKYLALNLSNKIKTVGRRLEEIRADVQDILRTSSFSWLLIFDGVEQQTDLKDYLPQHHTATKGHILITSRNQRWQQIKSFPLPLLTRQESINLLQKIIKQDGEVFSQEEEETAGNLADTLQYLPLALMQAGFYIKEGLLSISDYLNDFKTTYAEQWGNESAPVDYSHTVDTTFEISIKKIGEKGRQTLNYIAYFYHQEIPIEVIERLFSINRLKLNPIISQLSQFSLIEIHANKMYISIHKLIQLTVLKKIREEESKTIVEQIINDFIANYPIDFYQDDFFGKGEEYSFIAAHVESLYTHACKLNFEYDDIQHLIFLLAAVLSFRNYDKSLDLLKKLVRLKSKKLGSQDPAIAILYIIIRNIYNHREQWELGYAYARKAYIILKDHPEYGNDNELVKELASGVKNMEEHISKQVFNEKVIKQPKNACPIFTSVPYDIGDINETIAHYERAMRLTPLWQYRHKLAWYYYLDGREEFAEKLFAIGLTLHKDKAEIKFSYAYILYKNKELSKAIKLLKEVVSASNLETYNTYSSIDKPFLKDFELELYREEMSVNVLLLAYYLLIKCSVDLKDTGNQSLYEKNFQKLALEIKDASAYNLLASFYKGKKRIKKAIENFILSEESIIKFYVKDFNVLTPGKSFNLLIRDLNTPDFILSSICLKQKDEDENFEDSANTVNKHSLFYYSLLKLAYYHDANDNFDLAKDYFICATNILKHISISSSAVYVEFGLFLYKRACYQEAINLLQEAIGSCKDIKKLKHSYDLVELGRLDSYLQQQVLYYKSITINSYILAYYLLVLCYIGVKQYNEAMSYSTSLKNEKIFDKNNSLYVGMIEHLEISIKGLFAKKSEDTENIERPSMPEQNNISSSIIASSEQSLFNVASMVLLQPLEVFKGKTVITFEDIQHFASEFQQVTNNIPLKLRQEAFTILANQVENVNFQILSEDEQFSAIKKKIEDLRLNKDLVSLDNRKKLIFFLVALGKHDLIATLLDHTSTPLNKKIIDTAGPLSPLQLATLLGQWQTVKYLHEDQKLSLNENMKVTCTIGTKTVEVSCNILGLAILAEQKDVVRYLIKQLEGNSHRYRDLFTETNALGNPLHMAIYVNNLEILRYLLVFVTTKFEALGNERRGSHTDDDSGITPLMLAAFLGKIQAIELLFQKLEVNVNAIDNDDNTALHWAAKGKQYCSIRKLISLSAAIDPSPLNKKQQTPLELVKIFASPGESEPLDSDYQEIISLLSNKKMSDSLRHISRLTF